MNTLESRYLKIKSLITDKATLVAVSKTRSAKEISDLYQLGHRDFGENKVQELLVKSKELEHLDINWHFIGNLQKNKINQLLSIKGLKSIHSISSFDLLEKLQSKNIHKTIEIFLQINTSQEVEKSGFDSLEEIDEAVKSFAFSSSVEKFKLCGLMTIGKIRTENFEGAAIESFSRLQELKAKLDKKYNLDLKLSMGMSQDYEIALKYGADYIRIGTQIFGPRL